MSDTIILVMTETTEEGLALTQGLTPQEAAQIRRDAEQIRDNALREAAVELRAEAARARAQARAQGTFAQEHATPAVPPVPGVPAPPGEPRVIITTPDGKTVVVSGEQAERVLAAQSGEPFVFRPEIPGEAVVIALAFFIMLAFIAVGMPLARAFARRMDRQAEGRAAGSFPTDVSDRIERIEHAVEAIAIEVERISEGQRFTTKLLSEVRPDALAGAAVASADGAGKVTAAGTAAEQASVARRP